jgi:hypothetical protein
MTATAISASVVATPRFGAIPERIHAERLLYMMLRVPSIGSTIRRNAASSAVAPSGKERQPASSIPSAISTNGASSRLHASQKSNSISSLWASIV